MKKGILISWIVLILAAAGIFAYVRVPGMQEKLIALADEEFTQDNIYSDLASVSERLDEEILNGKESFTIYLKDMDVDEIGDINSSLDGIFGSGETYQQVGVIGEHYQKVQITIARTANYYAVQAYRNGTAVPDDQPKAQKLYEAIREILSTQLQEGMSDYEKELALHDYLVSHCRYSEDTDQPEESDVYRAYGALVNQDAVCNGYAEALQILFVCSGVESQFVVGTADGVDHAWNLVKIDGQWYHLDATWDDPVPDQGDKPLHPYFNVDDTVMEQSHTWNRQDYPQATHMEANYYKKTQSYYTSFEAYKEGAYQVMVEEQKPRFEGVIENYDTKQEDGMQFIFKNNNLYESVSWQSFQEGSYTVLVLEAE